MLVELVIRTALQFLGAEVPAWEPANHCYSCHNNGDAARSLYLAQHRGLPVRAESLSATTAWLLHPERWGEIRGAPAASDKNLARIQFASALAEAFRTGAVRDSGVLIAAAELLLTMQAADGSWPVDTGGLPGAPATYGTTLATYVSLRTLITADSARFAKPIERARQWLRAAKPANIPDAAAILLAIPARRDCLDLLLASQTSDGGWGPQAKVPAEAFDTALAIMALAAAHGPARAVERGRQFLIRTQDSAGAWPETTRPSGGVSYAERISTAGWVTYALIVTAAP